MLLSIEYSLLCFMFIYICLYIRCCRNIRTVDLEYMTASVIPLHFITLNNKTDPTMVRLIFVLEPKLEGKCIDPQA